MFLKASPGTSMRATTPQNRPSRIAPIMATPRMYGAVPSNCTAGIDRGEGSCLTHYACKLAEILPGKESVAPLKPDTVTSIEQNLKESADSVAVSPTGDEFSDDFTSLVPGSTD